MAVLRGFQPFSCVGVPSVLLDFSGVPRSFRPFSVLAVVGSRRKNILLFLDGSLLPLVLQLEAGWRFLVAFAFPGLVVGLRPVLSLYCSILGVQVGLEAGLGSGMLGLGALYSGCRHICHMSLLR